MSILNFDTELASPTITLPPDMYAKVRGAKAKVIIVTEEKPTSKTSPENMTRTFGSLKGTFTMSEDFHAPLDDFQDYM